MSWTSRAILLAVLALAAIAGWQRLTAYHERIGYQRAQAEYQAAAELQREGNRGRTRQAEQKHSAQAEVRERFIVTTVKEVRHATDNLAVCPLRPDAVRLFNSAAACAREDRPASCGAGEQVPASE